MTVKSETRVDIAEYKRAFEEWDIPALLGMYADDVELTMVSADNPPASPREAHGKAVFEGMFTHCKGAGAKANVENIVAGPDRAAATVACEFPGGRWVVTNAILELEDGRIVREHEVVAGDS